MCYIQLAADFKTTNLATKSLCLVRAGQARSQQLQKPGRKTDGSAFKCALKYNEQLIYTSRLADYGAS